MGVRRLAVAAVAALLMLAGVAAPARAASPCPVPGGFEIDGDLEAGTCTPSGDDWNTPGLNVGSTADGGTYGTASKDGDNPTGWTSTGSTVDKTNFSRAYAVSRVIGGHSYVYVAWERDTTSGTQNYAIEIDNAPANAPGGTPQPNRSNGGAVLYVASQGSAPPVFGSACSFTSQSTYGTTCTSSTAAFTGAINTAFVTDVFTGQPLAAGSFFEVALDVTALTGIAPSCPGPSAASVYLRSITGEGSNANLKGYLQPITIQPNSTCVSPPMTTTATPGGSANQPDTVQHDVVTVGTEDAPGVGTVRFYLCPPPVVTANGGDCSAGGTLVSTATLDAAGRASSATVGGEGGAVGTYCWRAEFTPGVGDEHYLPATHTDATAECFTIAPPPPSADLGVHKTGTPAPVAAGQNLTYTITLTNDGPDTADGVRLTDAVPAGTTFVSFAAPPGWTTTTPPASGTGTVSATTPAMAPGTATFTLVVKVNVTATGTVSNTATVAGTTDDPDPGNDTATTSTAVTAPLCTITGTSRGDALRGTAGNDVICGLGGNDAIVGLGGDDLIIAGDGADVVVGGPGADTILGGPGRDVLNSRDRVGGNDTVDGGAGTDVCLTDPGDTRISCP
ncbi:hypothetical protein ABZ484_16545 [Streptomyces sp. NPDC006393]|uniref:hypothetical protein n=1 Tax=Streptomyces sp. NPDC006393 TaxID=3156763 RepID=UPI0033C4AD17